MHRALTAEIHRLDKRETVLSRYVRTSAKPFVRELAAEAAERLAERREILFSAPRRQGFAPKTSGQGFKAK